VPWQGQQALGSTGLHASRWGITPGAGSGQGWWVGAARVVDGSIEP